MKKYVVCSRVMAITSIEAAKNVFEGMTADCDISYKCGWEFDDEEEAACELRTHACSYYYDGKGHGSAEEWWMEAEEVDASGNVIHKYPRKWLCEYSDIDDFKESLQEMIAEGLFSC